MLNHIYRDDVKHLEEFTKNSNELIEDFDFDGKAVFVNSVGASEDRGHDNAIAEDTTARSHDKYPGFIDFSRTKKVMILDAGYDVSTQTLLEFPKSLDEFSDYGITLVSVGHEEPNVTENYSSKAEALQALIESGIFPIFESHDDDDESTEEDTILHLASQSRATSILESLTEALTLENQLNQELLLGELEKMTLEMDTL